MVFSVLRVNRSSRFIVTHGFVAVLVVSVATSSHAEPSSPDNRALAEALFRDAKVLADGGQFDTACPKFEESHRLDPKPGTILNLAVCHEKQGKTATAWLDYMEAASFAARADQKDRESFANEQAAKLEKELVRLVVRVPDVTPGLVVKLDAVTLNQAAWGTAAPINPGQHLVEASARGYQAWSKPIAVDKGPAQIEVLVPKLDPAGASNSSKAGPQKEKPSVWFGSDGSGLNKPLWIGIATGAVGLAGIIVGSAFGARTFDKRDAGNAECGPAPKETYCTKAGIELHAQAESSATVSTVGFVVGGVGLGAGAALVWWGLRSRAPTTSKAWVFPHVNPTTAGVVAGYSF